MGTTQSTSGNQLSTQVRKYTARVGQFAANTPQHLQSAAKSLSQTATGIAALGESGQQVLIASKQALGPYAGLYGAVMSHTAKEQGKTGGSPSRSGYFGGNDSEDPSKALKEYRSSLAAATKGRLIHGLARALKQAGINVDPDAKPEDITRQLEKELPSIKNGKTFDADAKTHEKICRTIADVLNDEFTPSARKSDRLIDTSLGAVSVCRQVTEMVHSLTTGLHTEFLEVHASLTRILKNLTVLDEVLSELHNKIIDEISSAPDLGTGRDKTIADFDTIYKRAQLERKRQSLLLNNFLHVTLAPAKKELAIAMQEEGETHDIIKSIKLVPGSGKFADSLARAVSGLGTIAAVSARVDKALAAVGMGMEKYLKSSDISKLESHLDETLYSGKIDEKEIGKYLKAVQTLKENFYRRDELDLGNKMGGTSSQASYSGGIEPEKSTLDKRVEKRKAERKLIVKQFINKSTKHYDSLLKAIQELGPHLGKEIRLSDKLEALRNSLSRLGQSRLGALSLELSLIGYFSDAAAREKKETFLAGLRVVQAILDEVMSLEMYREVSHYFAAMRSAISDLIKTIDFYSDIIAKKYGGDDDEEKQGGQPEELAGLPEVARSSYDLERAISTFLYFYYVAKVRANLRQTHKELEFYGEKYNDILGDAVASRLRQLELEKVGIIKDGKLVDKEKDFVNAEYKCKVDFYRALQALDLYMKAFTEGIVAHPDEVKNIKRMLDGVTVIGRWFVEDTGDDLAAAFDMMPYDSTGTKTNIVQSADKHYYEAVATSTAVNNKFTVGNPQGNIPVKDADAVKSKINGVFDNFQALKNIINAFVRIGNKFGGKELRRQIFMSPTQIYKNLVEYMKCSALSMDKTTKNVSFGSVQDARSGNYAVEDKYLTFCIKAMGAKVLTVIGVYDLFERPSPVYDLTPTRMIIGGADYDAVPEVIAEAAELYFRLPRLAEFYKDLFAFTDIGGDIQISMMPEMDGVFSGLIRQIFQKVEGGAAASGDYSDLEVRALVREINAIFENFRGSDKSNVISEILSSFVMEINRRYGLVKRKEWDTLQKLLKESRRASEFGQLNKTNYAILPDEEEYEPERRAPSDRYMGPSGDLTAKLRGGKFSIDDKNWSQWKMLSKFRQKLDNFFGGVRPEDFTGYSFGTVIRQAKMELNRAKMELNRASSGKRIAIATRLIQGSASLSSIDVGKAYMFHETVVVGLNTLNAIFTMLSQMRQRLIDLDVVNMRATIIAWLKGLSGAAVVNSAAVSGLFTSAGMKSYVLSDGVELRGRGGLPVANGNDSDLVYGAAQLVAQAGAGFVAGVAETISIYALDSQKMMGDLLMIITGLTTTFQGLVTARFPGTRVAQIHLDFSGMRGLVQQLMDDVRYFMDLFRPHISKTVIQKYEDRTNVGSLYWLEDNLLDKLVRGLSGDKKAQTLEWFSRQVNQTFTTLAGYQRYGSTKLTGTVLSTGGANYLDDGGATATDPKNATGKNYYEQYGRLFARMVFYDAGMANSGVSAAWSGIGTGMGALIGTARPTTTNPRTLPKVSTTLAVTNRINVWNSQGGLLADRSLLFAFNQLLAKYIRVFYDAASGKIFRSLVDSFANGTFSRAVMTAGQSMPDLSDAARAQFGIRGDPSANGVLLQSLALILQRLVTDINPTTQISDHLVATLSEIPLYIRESFRANLPVFVKLFELVQKEGELIKQVLNQTGIQAGRTYTPQAAAALLKTAAIGTGDKVVTGANQVVTDAASNGYPLNSTLGSIVPLANSPGDSDGVKQVLVSVIDAVASGCYSISNSAVDVLRQLADESLYLQTSKNSIQEYKARYGKLPLMPLSSTFTFLRDLNGSNDDRLMPERSVGDQNFKFMYGTRKLLARSTSKFKLSDAPGILADLENFNSSASGREKIDKGRYGEYVSRIVTGLRFIVDTRNYRGILAPGGARGAPLRVSLVAAAGGATDANSIGIITSGSKANAAYSIRVTPQSTIMITESSFQDQEYRKISDAVGGAVVTLGQDRKREWIMNLIDMNIIPINVHALMRGIPLAPIYNYGYTFEQMCCLMFGETVENISNLSLDATKSNAVRNTRQMFLKMLIDPYMDIPLEFYGNSSAIHSGSGANGLVWRIFRGDDSLMMGRPKFISDQIFNKVLFGTMVDMPRTFDESGPSGSGRLASGIGIPRSATSMTSVEPLYPDKATLGVYPGLTYLGEPDDSGDASTALKRVQLGTNVMVKMQHLEVVGKHRFDTRIVRNLIFITNVQRLMRLKLNQELTQYRNVLVSNHSVVNPSVTEYGFSPNRLSTASQSRRFVGPNETSTSRQYDNERRLL